MTIVDEDLGLVPERVEALLARARREVDEGLLPSCQLAIARDGRVAMTATFGDATPATRYTGFSTTKPLVASAVLQLLAEDRLRLDDRVADLVPEFGTNGKDVVTVEQVLLHTAGFPRAPLGPLEWSSREARLRRFASWRLNWEPGTRFEYHPTSAHWVLAELLARLDGTDDDHRAVVHRRVVAAAGLPALRLGVPRSEQADIAGLVAVGAPPTPEELRAVYGEAAPQPTEVTTEALLGFDDPDTRAAGVPGGGMVTTAGDLALLYQAFLADRQGLWDATSLDDARRNVRNTFPDPTTGVPANRTTTFVVAGDDGRAVLRGFGRTASGATFGHGGAAGQIAWADPSTGLSFAYLTNGVDEHTLRVARRTVALSSLAARCTASGD